MPEGFSVNDQSKAGDAIPAIPTSSSEVAVRTMQSDVELMGKSGGLVGQAAPQGEQVPVTLHPDAPAAPEPSVPAPGRGKAVLVTVVVIIGALGLFALGYFVLGR